MENDWELDLMRLNVKVISTVYHNNSMTSFISFDCWKFLSLRLNLRVISVALLYTGC